MKQKEQKRKGWKRKKRRRKRMMMNLWQSQLRWMPREEKRLRQTCADAAMENAEHLD